MFPLIQSSSLMSFDVNINIAIPTSIVSTKSQSCKYFGIPPPPKKKKCALLLDVAEPWFTNWPDAVSMSRNMSPLL